MGMGFALVCALVYALVCALVCAFVSAFVSAFGLGRWDGSGCVATDQAESHLLLSNGRDHICLERTLRQLICRTHKLGLKLLQLALRFQLRWRSGM